MTENLLFKLEEKMMQLLSEVEDLRKEVASLSHENAAMKMDKENHAKKLQDLILLLDAVNNTETPVVNPTMLAVKPVLVQVDNVQQQEARQQ